MISENIQALLILVRSMLWNGIIGNGFWYSVGIILLGVMLKIEIQEKIELEVDRKHKNRR